MRHPVRWAKLVVESKPWGSLIAKLLNIGFYRDGGAYQAFKLAFEMAGVVDQCSTSMFKRSRIGGMALSILPRLGPLLRHPHYAAIKNEFLIVFINDLGVGLPAAVL